MASVSEPPPYGKYKDINADDTPSRFNKCMSDDLNIQERVAHYDAWAKTYDEDMKSYGFTGPEIAVEYLKRYFKNTNATFLDCGAGTGLLGVYTKELGYTNFHALDASSVALEKAKSREAYTNFIQEFITTGKLSIESGVYDGLVCCGCFVPGHLEPDCVEDWCRIVKPGGIVIIVMNQRWLSKEPSYNEGKLEGAFQKRVDEGKWELIVREQRDGYFVNDVAEVFVFRVK
ncbi:methyltransferase-like protein 27 [Anneissia japonica]|uniref:methyltransferase-like protein 27 n=1 Tax=Anneissia japonica TaxID=1529436 RepID=UPI0014257E5B|nr:methyltransferase-like protein 27 [Anneissia japonica]XP_033097207.1 methyltransferase-like protein 27 [Anneissia japonica]XP_033097208.1 methyltransferase-like protein 27 [Anneissia japonica]XP_033097209.1 methyltransferase-like protein 27 [Anneissia japonica]XP_033097210.1 methyltransferase-like protein 27 [Anneissia japonica]XP_033097211.1 methyltransferase-like protein 27 [Anneissia japonica]XP_033097213.1 methyltransferase-like protein 27 [Anneissia japonica]